MLSPDVIIFGGGVMKQRHMVEKVHQAFERLVNGYVKTPAVADYIVTPELEDNAGTLGCLALARSCVTFLIHVITPKHWCDFLMIEGIIWRSKSRMRILKAEVERDENCSS